MIALMLRSFGRDAPANTAGLRHTCLWLIAAVFVTASVLILVVVNFFTLFFGVTVNFLGRDGVNFRFLHLFGRIPLIAVTLPVLLGYAIWHNVQVSGAFNVAFPALLTVVLALTALALTVLLNNLFGAHFDRR
jgi:hypothetical protein